MTNRFPLILDQNEQKVKEIPSGDSLNLTGNDISSVRNILPETTETYDLGSIGLKWKDLYLSGNSIFIGDGSISLANGVFTFTDENDQNLIFSADGTQFTNVTANTITADFFVGDGSQVDNVDAITLEGSNKAYFENYAETFANSAYANAVIYIDNEIASLVNSAPGVLDTLNELAEAIGDDDNFFVTVNNNINTAYSNAVSEAAILANNAFTNAVAYVDEQTTDTIEEGNTNLYFTENRVIDAVENNTVNTVSVESSFILPVGNTDSRPSPAITGMMRFNTELNDFEGYNGIEWVSFESSFSFENNVDLQEESGTTDLQEESGTDDLTN